MITVEIYACTYQMRKPIIVSALQVSATAIKELGFPKIAKFSRFSSIRMAILCSLDGVGNLQELAYGSFRIGKWAVRSADGSIALLGSCDVRLMHQVCPSLWLSKVCPHGQRIVGFGGWEGVRSPRSHRVALSPIVDEVGLASEQEFVRLDF